MASDLVYCPDCGRPVQPGWRTCRSCGGSLPVAHRSPPRGTLREPPVAFTPAGGSLVSVPEYHARMRRKIRRRRSMVWWGVVPAILIVVIIIVIVLISRGPLPNPTSVTATIIPAGTTIQVNDTSYAYYAFSLVVSEHISGAFQAAPTVKVFVLNQTQLVGINSSGGPPAGQWTWASGNVSQGTVDLLLKRGPWYLEFVNPWTTTSTNVTVTTAFRSQT